MKTGGMIIATILALTVFGCQPRPQVKGPSVTFELEVTGSGIWDDENSLAIAGTWISLAMSSATDIGERGFLVETVAPSLVKITVPEDDQVTASDFLQLLDSNPTLNFHAVHPDTIPLAAQVSAGGQIVPGYLIKSSADTPPVPYLLKIPAEVSGSSIKSARPDNGQNGWSIVIDFDESGAAAMGAFTSAHVGDQLAIVLGDEVLSVPVIRQPFSDGAMITGDFSESEVQMIATLLDNPPQFSFTLNKTAPAPANPPAP